MVEPSSQIICDCIEHLNGLYNIFRERYSDVIKTDFPVWYGDLRRFDYNTSNLDSKLVEELIDLRENTQLLDSIDKNGISGFIEIQETNPKIYELIDPIIISFPITWLVEARFSAVLETFNGKRSSLDLNKRGNIRVKLNKSILIDYEKLYKVHQEQGSH